MDFCWSLFPNNHFCLAISTFSYDEAHRMRSDMTYTKITGNRTRSRNMTLTFGKGFFAIHFQFFESGFRRDSIYAVYANVNAYATLRYPCIFGPPLSDLSSLGKPAWVVSLRIQPSHSHESLHFVAFANRLRSRTCGIKLVCTHIFHVFCRIRITYNAYTEYHLYGHDQ